jgi:hypothetical protein
LAESLLEVGLTSREEGLQEEEYLPTQRYHQNGARNFLASRWFKIGKEVILITLAIWGLGSIIYQVRNSWPRSHLHVLSYSAEDVEPCYCGESIAEAISLGCKYDELSAAWLPERCRDEELTAEFSRAGPGPNGTWTYWADRNHTKELTLHEVSLYAEKQPELFHTTWEWHVMHCVFSWRKEHRSRYNGITYEPRSDTEHHIMHCGGLFLNRSYGTTSGVVLVS